MELKKEGIQIFVCPVCHGALRFDDEQGDGSGFVCGACSLLYPVVDGIPDFLLEDAVQLKGKTGESRRGDIGAKSAEHDQQGPSN